MMYKEQWQSLVALVLGLYVVVSPWLIPYFAPASTLGHVAMWSHFVSGTAVIFVAVLAMSEFRLWEAWVATLLGAWIVMAPWTLGFASARVFTWNSVIAGLILIAISLGPLKSDSARSA